MVVVAEINEGELREARIRNIQCELFTTRCCEPVGQMKRIIYQTHLNHCRQQTLVYIRMDLHNIYFTAVSRLASLHI